MDLTKALEQFIQNFNRDRNDLGSISPKLAREYGIRFDMHKTPMDRNGNQWNEKDSL
jgi:hypothetical protein